jgi:hypothetical protein
MLATPIFFTAEQDAQAVSTAVDLFHFTIADDKPMWLWALEICQTTDLGDSNEEVLRLGFYSAVSGGGGGSALTENALSDYHGVTAGTAVVGQGTASTGGTLRKSFYWNIRQAGPVWIATPETAIRVAQGSSACAIRFKAAPADSITLSAEATWAEG